MDGMVQKRVGLDMNARMGHGTYGIQNRRIIRNIDDIRLSTAPTLVVDDVANVDQAASVAHAARSRRTTAFVAIGVVLGLTGIIGTAVAMTGGSDKPSAAQSAAAGIPTGQSQLSEDSNTTQQSKPALAATAPAPATDPAQADRNLQPDVQPAPTRRATAPRPAAQRLAPAATAAPAPAPVSAPATTAITPDTTVAPSDTAQVTPPVENQPIVEPATGVGVPPADSQPDL